MERLWIRGRILTLFAGNCDIEEDAWDGEPAYSIEADELTEMLAHEFGVTLAPDRLPELLTVNWLVDVVAELTHGQPN